MASSRRFSGGADWTDVAMLIVAFEAINECKLELRVEAVDHKGKGDLCLKAVANDRREPIGDLPPLGSASVRCSATKLITLEGAIIQLLYQLDGQLAGGEFGKVIGG